MKWILAVAFAILFSIPAFASDVYVDGYYRQDGTYVPGHYRSSPDGNPYNNWTTRSNTNPYTGEPGYRTPDPYRDYRNSGRDRSRDSDGRLRR